MIRAAALTVVLLAAACAPEQTDNAAVSRDFAEHRSNVEVTASGAVHQRFIVQLSGLSQTLLVDNNVDIGRRVPLGQGDLVTVHGEYVWNDQGGLVHFTHHDPVHTHEGGWIEVRGVRYE